MVCQAWVGVGSIWLKIKSLILQIWVIIKFDLLMGSAPGSGWSKFDLLKCQVADFANLPFFLAEFSKSDLSGLRLVISKEEGLQICNEALEERDLKVL
jgi:hypothetical protein